MARSSAAEGGLQRPCPRWLREWTRRPRSCGAEFQSNSDPSTLTSSPERGTFSLVIKAVVLTERAQRPALHTIQSRVSRVLRREQGCGRVRVGRGSQQARVLRRRDGQGEEERRGEVSGEDPRRTAHLRRLVALRS